jgi:organic radical activating enzyme
MNDLYCPMIHGGLNINMKSTEDKISFNQCCLSTIGPLNSNFLQDFSLDWNDKAFIKIREQNNNNIWDAGCSQCERLEKVGIKSFRHSMIEKFGIKKHLSGPQRIDLLFDRTCNLACRTCGPRDSTFWQKHLEDNNIEFVRYDNNTNNFEQIHKTLQSLDLSHLGMLQFCGGETLLGNSYWQAAKAIAELVPDAKSKIELGFQTNGTQPVDEKHFATIEKFKLVKFMISIDGVKDRFNYLRWPASWNQVVDNVMYLREKLPSNVMFLYRNAQVV